MPIWCLAFCMYTTISATANTRIDSLNNLLAQQQENTIKVQLFNALAYEYLLSNPAETRRTAGKARDLAKSLEDEKGLARSLSLLGSSYWAQGIYDKSLAYYFKALDKYETIAFQEGIAYTLNNIGEVYKKQNNLGVALKYQLRAMDILENQKHSTVPALTYNNLAEIYFQTEKYIKALEYYSKALEIAKSKNNELVMAYAYQGMGTIHYYEAEMIQAIDFHTKALKIREKHDDLRGVASSCNLLANIHLDLAHKEEAKVYLDKSHRAILKSGSKDLKATNYKILSRYHALTQDYKLSLHFLKKHNHLKDSILNKKKALQLASIRTGYEASASEKENQLLLIDREMKEAKIRMQTMTIIAIVSALFFVIVVAVLIYYKRMEWKRKRVLLRSKNEEIQNRNHKLATQAKELHTLNEALAEINQTIMPEPKLRHSHTGRNKPPVIISENEAQRLHQPIATIKGLLNLIEYSRPSKSNTKIVSYLKESTHELDELIAAMKKKDGNDEG